MDKFEKIYDELIPSNIIVDKDSIMKCIEIAYNMGVLETEKKFSGIKNTYDSIIEDLIDDPRCETVKQISVYNKKRLLNSL